MCQEFKSDSLCIKLETTNMPISRLDLDDSFF